MRVCTLYNAAGNTSHLDIVPQLCVQIIQLNFPNTLHFHHAISSLIDWLYKMDVVK